MPSDGATKFDHLDEEVKDMLRHLRPSEIETLMYLASLPKDDVEGMLKNYRDLRTVSRFARWAILTVIAVFLGAVALGESALKALGWLRSPG